VAGPTWNTLADSLDLSAGRCLDSVDAVTHQLIGSLQSSGSGTVDYAVDLDPGPQGLETFWGLHYSARPDPAFILPWRLDVEKGMGLNPNLKFYSKSLKVSPSTPAPGENVHITARVHNFSLKDTDGPAMVRFYLGKPDSPVRGGSRFPMFTPAVCRPSGASSYPPPSHFTYITPLRGSGHRVYFSPPPFFPEVARRGATFVASTGKREAACPREGRTRA